LKNHTHRGWSSVYFIQRSFINDRGHTESNGKVILIHEYGGMWKKAVVVYFKEPSQNFLGETDKNQRKNEVGKESNTGT
jgi:hypothetical protein